MPLPTPNKGEEKQNFISRCVSEISDMGEFDSQKQRVAVCYSQWDKENESMNILDKIDRVLNEKAIVNEGLGKWAKIIGKIALGMDVSDRELAYAAPGFVDFDGPFKKATLDAIKRADTYDDMVRILKDWKYFGDRIEDKTHNEIKKAFDEKARKLGVLDEE